MLVEHFKSVLTVYMEYEYREETILRVPFQNMGLSRFRFVDKFNLYQTEYLTR